MDGGVITDARVGLAAVGPNTTGIPAISEALRGQAPSEELYAQAGAIAADSCTPGHRHARQRRVQASSGRRAHPAHAAPRRRPHQRNRRPEHAGVDDGQRRRGHARRSRAACCWSTSCATSSAHRHALGLRHQQLRHLRGLDGRRAGEVLHGARGDGRRARGPHRRGPRAGRRARPGAAGLHGVPRPAVRLLHARHDDDRAGPARPQPRPDRRRDPRGDLRPDLPLHRLRDDRPLDPMGRRRARSRQPRSRYRWERRHDHRRGPPGRTAGFVRTTTRSRSATAGCCARRTRASSAAGAATSTTSSCTGMLHLAILRSPVAHARIVSIDISAAQAHPKVKAVVTGAELAEQGSGLDADPVERRAGRAGHRQGALPGPGGRVRRRRGPLLRA